MSLNKRLAFVCLFVVGFVLIHVYLVGIEKDKAYQQGYDDGMAAISPDYCLKEFSQNDTRKFRYIQRQYCKGIVRSL
jgi:hypothetical protein